jgi:acyl-CoA synthetase (AMP-forming)/AMP-acid ligase II
VLSNVARFLPDIARAHPAVCAVRAPVGDDPARPGHIKYAELSFAELDAEADATARLLQSRGIARGTRVLLLVRPGLDLLRCAFALFKLGAVPILLDPGMGLKNFLACVRRSQPAALVGISRAHWLARFFPGALRSAQVRVQVGGRAWDKSLAAHRSAAPFPVAPTAGSDLAAVLFTSGSTGAPKGVCYEHSMFEAQVRLIRDHYGIAPGEVDLPMLPIFALFNPALGMTTIVPEINPSRPAACDPARVVQAIRQNNVTNSFGSPALWARVAAYCEQSGVTLPSLRRVLVAGAPVHPGLLRRLQKILPNGTAHVPYGATESLPVSSISLSEVLGETWSATEQGRGTCVGTLFPGMSARIIPLHDGPLAVLPPPLPLGEIGEIAVTGPVVTRAYDQLPAATTAAKIPDDSAASQLETRNSKLETSPPVWHRLGDLGYRDAQGRLWFCGRAAERVETPSGTYYTDCVEAVFNRHPRIARCALIGLCPPHLPSPPRHKTPALVVEPLPSHFPSSLADRKAFTAELLALGSSLPHTQPITEIYFQRRLPVDVRHNAKIHRLALGRRYSAQIIWDVRP